MDFDYDDYVMPNPSQETVWMSPMELKASRALPNLYRPKPAFVKADRDYKAKQEAAKETFRNLRNPYRGDYEPRKMERRDPEPWEKRRILQEDAKERRRKQKVDEKRIEERWVKIPAGVGWRFVPKINPDLDILRPKADVWMVYNDKGMHYETKGGVIVNKDGSPLKLPPRATQIVVGGAIASKIAKNKAIALAKLKNKRK